MKEIEYELNIGHALCNGLVFVDDNATDAEIALSVLNDLYDYTLMEVTQNQKK